MIGGGAGRLGPDTVSGLRTRFLPKSRIGQGLISAAPWLDIVLLMVLLALLQGKFVLQPGMVVELPRVAFGEGTLPALSMVVVAAPAPGGTGRREIVFFDDNRYRVERAAAMERLQEDLARYGRMQEGSDLVVLADRHVGHGTIMDLCDMARAVGMERVNVAARPTDAPP